MTFTFRGNRAKSSLAQNDDKHLNETLHSVEKHGKRIIGASELVQVKLQNTNGKLLIYRYSSGYGVYDEIVT